MVTALNIKKEYASREFLVSKFAFIKRNEEHSQNKKNKKKSLKRVKKHHQQTKEIYVKISVFQLSHEIKNIGRRKWYPDLISRLGKTFFAAATFKDSRDVSFSDGVKSL